MANDQAQAVERFSERENKNFLTKYTILMFVRLLLTIGPPVGTLIAIYCISPQKTNLFPLAIPIFLGWMLFVITKLLRPMERWTFNES